MLASRNALLAALMILLTGCAGPQVDDYGAERPLFDLREYFDGELEAWGMFQDRSGRVLKRFSVTINASWQGDEGRLEEDFVYSDGKTQRRIWMINRLDAQTYTGRAADVIGEATGRASGNALRWRYVLALDVEGKTYHVNFDDWMYLVDDKILLNRSEMRKFGFRLGEVTLAFRKKG